MSSADLHPNLFHTETFRVNVTRAIRFYNAPYKGMLKACGVDAMTFCLWLNEKEEPVDSSVDKLIEYLKSIGYEWE